MEEILDDIFDGADTEPQEVKPAERVADKSKSTKTGIAGKALDEKEKKDIDNAQNMKHYRDIIERESRSQETRETETRSANEGFFNDFIEMEKGNLYFDNDDLNRKEFAYRLIRTTDGRKDGEFDPYHLAKVVRGGWKPVTNSEIPSCANLNPNEFVTRGEYILHKRPIEVENRYRAVVEANTLKHQDVMDSFVTKNNAVGARGKIEISGRVPTAQK